jgi:cell wall-associated NlpC family hydrolase
VAALAGSAPKTGDEDHLFMKPFSLDRVLLEHVIGNHVAACGLRLRQLQELHSALSDTDRDVALQAAWSLYGTPYIWGGDDPVRGFDCSGLVVEVLQSVGILKHGSDYTAQSLWEMFITSAVNEPYAGCLVFWAVDPQSPPHHIELCINDHLSIGASGGGSKTVTERDAIDQNAYIKVRPFRTRGGYLRFVDPFKKESQQ